MQNRPLDTVLHLLNAAGFIGQKISGPLGALHGMSLQELMLMMHLEHAPSHRLSRVELSRRLYTSASTITRMAAPLEKTGYVKRESDPRDARLAFVVLTAPGRKRVAEARQTLEKLAEDLFGSHWTAKEVAALSQALDRLTTNTSGRMT